MFLCKISAIQADKDISVILSNSIFFSANSLSKVILMSWYPFIAHSQREKFPWIDLCSCWENQFLWLCNVVYYSQRDFNEVIYNPVLPVYEYNLFIKLCELKIDLTPSSFTINFPSQNKSVVKPLFLASESLEKKFIYFAGISDCWMSVIKTLSQFRVREEKKRSSLGSLQVVASLQMCVSFPLLPLIVLES